MLHSPVVGLIFYFLVGLSFPPREALNLGAQGAAPPQACGWWLCNFSITLIQCKCLVYLCGFISHLLFRVIDLYLSLLGFSNSSSLSFFFLPTVAPSPHLQSHSENSKPSSGAPCFPYPFSWEALPCTRGSDWGGKPGSVVQGGDCFRNGVPLVNFPDAQLVEWAGERPWWSLVPERIDYISANAPHLLWTAQRCILKQKLVPSLPGKGDGAGRNRFHRCFFLQKINSSLCLGCQFSPTTLAFHILPKVYSSFFFFFFFLVGECVSAPLSWQLNFVPLTHVVSAVGQPGRQRKGRGKSWGKWSVLWLWPVRL